MRRGGTINSNYTIDTLAALRRQLQPEDALFCILGADSFLTIGQWYRSADLADGLRLYCRRSPRLCSR